MQRIKLLRNKYALVDGQDFKWLNKWKWEPRKGCHTYYAIRRPFVNKKRIIIFMHGLIMSTPKNREIDHKNGDGLDNRRKNLRIVTRIENQHNRIYQKNNKSGCIGVCWINRFKKWVVHININCKKVTLGYFKNIDDAIKLRKLAEIKYYGKNQ